MRAHHQALLRFALLRLRPVLSQVVAFAERDAKLALEAEDLVRGPVA